MALRIIRSTDPITVTRLNVCIYAAPGLGKTSISFTADKPLLLDFDRGAHRSANRKDTVQVERWEDVAHITADDLADFNTVVVDTAGRALDTLTPDIIRRNPKMGRGGSLTLQGFGQLKAEFVAWLKHLNSLGKDVVLIAHMDEQRNGDEIIERLDVQGGSKGEIYKAADAMGRLSIRDGKRMLNFSPTDASFGKNPGQLEPLEVPHPERDPQFLARVIQQIKDRLNAMTEEQREAQAALEKWRERTTAAEDVTAVNALLPEAKGGSQAMKVLLNDRAAALGLTFDSKAGQYAAPKAA
ncbi:ATP-binding protein [Stenotrophomonas maltophilia]|uniref:ATP-binding protein n=1 Tax=Stenotrophomonas maltophilia TaxID=40324 RepID=UPI001F34FE34|nr:ATP-binding protein [Stenotrophomonas maltophilia]MCF3455376.1 AAA family ATPase [Stenotrophomonas maltophilia]MCF3540817.1 AAA family ATPase [Stenotrophomonas maltophilia]